MAVVKPLSELRPPERFRCKRKRRKSTVKTTIETVREVSWETQQAENCEENRSRAGRFLIKHRGLKTALRTKAVREILSNT